MVTTVGKVKVLVEAVADTASVSRAGGNLGKSLKTTALAAGAVLGTITAGAITSVKAFEEAQAASAKLENVLGNMGKTGGAVDNVEKLADSLSRTAGIDDEVIKGGQTLLATFSEVAKSAGDVGGTFDRATRAAVDLSAAGFGSVESQAVALGKALQDPLKGITALGRAGVTFSEAQKEQIKGFVETNDLASAQALILAEVEKQVKGTAEASVTESARIGVAMGEIQESIGLALGELTSGKVNTLSEAMFGLSDSIAELAKSEDWQDLGRDLRGVAGDARAVGKAFAFIEDTGDGLIEKLPGWNDDFELSGGLLANAADKIGKFIDGLNELDQNTDNFISERLLGGPLSQFLGINQTDPNSIIHPHATGVRGAKGWSLVGERGPELVRIPGADVFNHQETARMLEPAGGGSFTYAPVFNGPSTGSERLKELTWTAKYGTRYGTSVGGI